MPEWSEVFVILVVAMVVFGPHRLPTMARKAGKIMAEFRLAARELRQGLEQELALEEMREAAKDVMASTKEASQDLHKSLAESEQALRLPPPLAQPSDTKPGAERSASKSPDHPEPDTDPPQAEQTGQVESAASVPTDTRLGSSTASPDEGSSTVSDDTSHPDTES